MIKEGQPSKSVCKLSDGNIQRLEAVGFKWNILERLSFDDHVKDLQAFKEEHGHCNVTQSTSHRKKYLSLGKWCSSIRHSYKIIKQGGKEHLINYLMPISSALKGWDSIGAYENMKQLLLMIASRIYKPSKRNMDIAMLRNQNHTGRNIYHLEVGAAV
jgi:hypothetical protein